jgi:hypothetical protein
VVVRLSSSTEYKEVRRKRREREKDEEKMKKEPKPNYIA